MSTARAERLVNLVLCLLSTRQYLAADRIRTIVPGYGDTPTDEAFFRMFERDKSELRDLGVPLETGRNSAFDTVDGYRIARRDYELPDIELAPDEAAAVALAARLWDSPDLAGAARGALLKLRAAGVEVHDEDAAVQPRVRAAGPAFAGLLAAVQEGRAVRFEYRRHPGDTPQQRTLEPWGVVSWRGRWYVAGHDRGRSAPRCFRLTRILGEVTPVGRPGTVKRPDGVDLLSMVGSSSHRHHTAGTAATGTAATGTAVGSGGVAPTSGSATAGTEHPAGGPAASGHGEDSGHVLSDSRTGTEGGVTGEHGAGDDSRNHTATLWLATGRAQGLRRRARVLSSRTLDGVHGDLVEIDLHWPETAARWIAGHGPDAAVVEPGWLRDMVLHRLTAAAAAPTTAPAAPESGIEHVPAGASGNGGVATGRTAGSAGVTATAGTGATAGATATAGTGATAAMGRAASGAVVNR